MRRGFLGGVLLIALTQSVGAQQAPGAVTRPRTTAEDLQLFSQVFNQIRVNHPDSVDAHRLFMAAIQAMVQATDPHSYVIPAVRLVPGKEAELRAGKLHPVPVSFTYVGGTPVVASVAAGTAAARLDILPGDELAAIDGTPVRAESALELEITLAGPRNSAVALSFERRRADGTYVTLQRTVKRERFDEESAVPAALMLDARTGYVRITSFGNQKVAADLRAALQRLEDAGMQRLVLDLRQNPGGIIEEAANVAGEFLPTGSVVYTSEGRKAAATDTGRVKRSFWRGERQYPMVVMIDDGSASAAELVAGALQDHDRAVIVGQPSFGKSLMMQGFPLSDGSILVLVIGQVRTPCGRVVQRQYRGVRTRDYYRLAAAERDTVGRPTCKTKGGRTVYGGGGIYPDVRTPKPAEPPAWYAKVNELELPMAWVGGFMSEQGNALGALSSFASDPRLPSGTMEAFRAFATGRGVTIPASESDDAALRRLLLQTVSYAKWGSAGLYQVEARTDPDVRHAITLLPAPPPPAR